MRFKKIVSVFCILRISPQTLFCDFNVHILNYQSTSLFRRTCDRRSRRRRKLQLRTEYLADIRSRDKARYNNTRRSRFDRRGIEEPHKNIASSRTARQSTKAKKKREENLHLNEEEKFVVVK